MIQKQSMGLEIARKAVHAALATPAPGDAPFAVAVADENGDLVYATRLDGTPALHVRLALGKAYTAAFIGRDTRAFRDQILDDGRRLADWSDPLMTTLTGGLTVRYQGQVVGGIGVSGNDADRDEALARVALEAMGLSGSS